MWLIGGACTDLRGVAGANGDTPTPGRTSRVSILADSKTAFGRTFLDGESAPFSIPLKGVNNIMSTTQGHPRADFP